MARHRSTPRSSGWIAVGVVAVVGVIALAFGLVATVVHSGGDSDGTSAAGASTTSNGDCGRSLRVVTASSFRPALEAFAERLATGPDCVDLNITVADGRAAAQRVKELPADAWIPDDVAWGAT